MPDLKVRLLALVLVSIFIIRCFERFSVRHKKVWGFCVQRYLTFSEGKLEYKI